ncbi:MAG TPA: glycoside hydrolase family 15 protein [Mycobacteriales bacterium]|nr:glycoside hydrolase family 15 protein [Mycobacteriales bacterium]
MRRTARGQTSARAEEPAESLRQMALCADGERGMVIGSHGEIGWLCFPRWDSPAVLSGLLGGQSHYSIAPLGRCTWGGTYVERSLAWEGRWVLTDSEVTCRDALVAPGDDDRLVLLRRVTGVSGRTRLAVTLDLRAGFDRQPSRDLRRGRDGTWSGRCGPHWWTWQSGATRTATVPAGRGEALHGTFTVEAGQCIDFVLVLATTESRASPVDPNGAWSDTLAWWTDRMRLEVPVRHARRDARHARAVLTGLTSRHGGMVAAATTSLPERADRGRDYDYRFAWIRDQCFAGQAAASAGDAALLDNAVRFVAERILADGPDLCPAYAVDGGRVPPETTLPLPGYPGGKAIAGNRVTAQHQLDAFGEALSLLAAADEVAGLDEELWNAVEVAATAIAAQWEQPDAGIWELEPAQWTHSKLMCVAGLRAIAQRPRAGGRAGEYAKLADTILARTAATSTHPSGRWQRAEDDDRVDAALLFAVIRGALPPDDPRSQRTLRAVLDDLTDDGYVYRFRHDGRPLNEAEGAFVLCGFAMSLAQLRHDDPVAAMAWFERSRTACGPPGLLTEEYDVRERQPRGNLPQAFVHALLLEAAHALSTAVPDNCPDAATS